MDDWISQAEASRLRGVSRQAIAKLLKNGRFRSFEIGGRVFVSKADVMNYKQRKAGRPKKVDSDVEDK